MHTSWLFNTSVPKKRGYFLGCDWWIPQRARTAQSLYMWISKRKETHQASHKNESQWRQTYFKKGAGECSLQLKTGLASETTEKSDCNPFPERKQVSTPVAHEQQWKSSKTHSTLQRYLEKWHMTPVNAHPLLRKELIPSLPAPACTNLEIFLGQLQARSSHPFSPRYCLLFSNTQLEFSFSWAAWRHLPTPPHSYPQLCLFPSHRMGLP